MKSSFTRLLPFYRQWRLRVWRKALALDKHQAVFDALYKDVNGFSLSKASRITNDAPEYTYGEIDFLSFVALLGRCKPDQSTIFYDLGSGTGKAVLAIAMVYKIRQATGIELFPALHEAASNQKTNLALNTDYQAIADSIQFIQGNFLNEEFTSATLIFINSSAFFGQTWQDISIKLEQVCPGCRVITTSKPLASALFKAEEETLVSMSWGVVKAFIQSRI